MPPLINSSLPGRLAPWLATAALALAAALGLGNMLLARRVAALEAELAAMHRSLADHAEGSLRDHQEMGRLLRELRRELPLLRILQPPPAGQVEPLP